MVKVRMLLIEAGPAGHFDVGAVREVDERTASMLVAVKAAEVVTEPLEEAAAVAAPVARVVKPSKKGKVE